jgi:hypothetical protein
VTIRTSLCALSAITFLVACGACGAGTAGQLPNPVQPPARTTPSPQVPNASPSPTPAKPLVVRATIAVSFTGLKLGSYPVHLHSACNGAQSFHIAIEQSLVIDRGGSGRISVASSNFGRGLCLIVYSSSTLTAVLTVRRI